MWVNSTCETTAERHEHITGKKIEIFDSSKKSRK